MSVYSSPQRPEHPGQCLSVDGNGKVETILNSDDDEDYSVGIYRHDPILLPGQPTTGSQDHLPQSLGNEYHATLGVGLPYTGARWVQWYSQVQVSAVATVSFNVGNPCHWGCENADADEMVPNVLQLELHPSLKPGTNDACDSLNERTVLTHAHLHQCFWISPAIDCGDKVDPAHWVLRKTDKKTWLLTLRRITGDLDLAVYHSDTASESNKKAPFRITLKRGKVTKEFKNWPATITLRESKERK